MSILRVASLLVLMQLAGCGLHFVRPQEKPESCQTCEFRGTWELVPNEASARDGFPWWMETRYPSRITIQPSGDGRVRVRFQDQKGSYCEPKLPVYDRKENVIAFKHCLPMSDPDVIELYYVLSVDSGVLTGRVQDYSTQFKLAGRKVD